MWAPVFTPKLALSPIIYAGKRESSAKFDNSPTQSYTSENGQFAPLLTVDCRGLEFVGFDPKVSNIVQQLYGLVLA